MVNWGSGSGSGSGLHSGSARPDPVIFHICSTITGNRDLIGHSQMVEKIAKIVVKIAKMVVKIRKSV